MPEKHPSPYACWKCGASLESVPLPFARNAVCPACGPDLHVCRMCQFYDVGVSNACREPIADPVTDKEKANFCGYLQPLQNAFEPSDTAAVRKAKAEFAALFGLAEKQSETDQDSDSPAERAQKAWDELFATGKGDHKEDTS